MSLEGIALVLRNLRGRLDPEQAISGAASGATWPSPVAECVADLDAYDQALVSAAGMLEVPLPSPPPGDRRFTPDQRAQAEAGLVDAGVDLRGERLDGEPDREPHVEGDAPLTTAGAAAESLRRLLGAPEPGDSPADTPPGPPLPQPGIGSSNGRALWRCEHCDWEAAAWVRPECPRCYTMSTQAVRWL